MYFKCIKGFASISLKPAHSTKVQFTAATRCTERGQFHAGANHSLSAPLYRRAPAGCVRAVFVLVAN